MGQLHKILLARNAMATRFEIALFGSEPRNLRAAGEEALDEIERIESRISPFKTESEIFLLNKYAYKQPIIVSPEIFDLLKVCKEIWQITGGVFDPTIGPLMKLWGFRGGTSTVPSEEKIMRVKSCCGMNLVELDETRRAVKFRSPEIQLDLGAVGKGYAIDQAVTILRECGISSAIIHGGTSTAAAFGSPPPPEKWKIAIELPLHLSKNAKTPISVVDLKDNSLSVSAVWGRKSEISGKEYGHIIDPRTGKPAHNCIMTAVLHKSAMYSDAISTALLVGGEELGEKLIEKGTYIDLLIVKKSQNSDDLTILKTGPF